MKVSRENMPRTYAVKDAVLKALKEADTQEKYQAALKASFAAVFYLCTELEGELTAIAQGKD